MSLVDNNTALTASNNVTSSTITTNNNSGAGGSGTLSGTATPPITTTTPSSTTTKVKNKRLEMDPIASEMLGYLGPQNWDRYQGNLNYFLIGKRSRLEFNEAMDLVFNEAVKNQTSESGSVNVSVGSLKKLHNRLVLVLLSNSMRESAASEFDESTKFTISSHLKKNSSTNANSKISKTGKSNKSKASSQYEKLKRTIMSLPIRERHRIKSITRDSGKRSMATSSLTLTRQALLPKTPYTNDKERAMPLASEWNHDIVTGMNTPLAAELYALPDTDNLTRRLTGVAREHGLTGIVEQQAVEMVYLGLESYLKTVLESAIDTVRFRRARYDESDLANMGSFLNGGGELTTKREEQHECEANRNEDDEHDDNKADGSVKKEKRKIVLTNEDLIDTLHISPFLVEPSVPLYKLHSVKLQDDTQIVGSNDKWSDSLKLKPRSEVMAAAAAAAATTTATVATATTTASTPASSGSALSSPLALKKEVVVAEGGGAAAGGMMMTKTEVKSPGIRAGGSGGSASNSPLSMQRSLELKERENEGTKDELNWVLHDLLSSSNW